MQSNDTSPSPRVGSFIPLLLDAATADDAESSQSRPNQQLELQQQTSQNGTARANINHNNGTASTAFATHPSLPSATNMGGMSNQQRNLLNSIMMTRGQNLQIPAPTTTNGYSSEAMLAVQNSNMQLQHVRNALLLEQQRAQVAAQLGLSPRYNNVNHPQRSSNNTTSDQLSRAYLELSAQQNAGASVHQKLELLGSAAAATGSGSALAAAAAQLPLKARHLLCAQTGTSLGQNTNQAQQQQQQQQQQSSSSAMFHQNADPNSFLSYILSGRNVSALELGGWNVNAVQQAQQRQASFVHRSAQRQQREQQCRIAETPATSVSTGPSKKRGMTILAPCRARGMPVDHNPKTAHFIISEDLEHGTELVCSYSACRNNGVKFCFCAYCQTPVAKRNFRKRHMHDHEDNGTQKPNVLSSSSKSESERNNKKTVAHTVSGHNASPSAANSEKQNETFNSATQAMMESSQDQFSSRAGGGLNIAGKQEGAQSLDTTKRISDNSSGTTPGVASTNTEKMRQVIRKLLSEYDVTGKRYSDDNNLNSDYVVMEGKKSSVRAPNRKATKSNSGGICKGSDHEELSSMSGNSDDEYRGLIRAHNSKVNAGISAGKPRDSSTAIGKDLESKIKGGDEIVALESWVKLLFARPTVNADPQAISTWVLQILQTSGDFQDIFSKES